MQTASEPKPLPEVNELDARVWVRNPRRFTMPFCIEPWGTELHLLPGTSYVVVTQFRAAKEIVAPVLEPDLYLTVWPQGTQSNRVYREDGSLVWDDGHPGEVYPLFDEQTVSIALDLVKTLPRVDTRTLWMKLQAVLPASRQTREDLPYLLVEHGFLDLGDDGYLTVRSPQPTGG